MTTADSEIQGTSRAADDATRQLERRTCPGGLPDSEVAGGPGGLGRRRGPRQSGASESESDSEARTVGHRSEQAADGRPGTQGMISRTYQALPAGTCTTQYEGVSRSRVKTAARPPL